MRQAGDGRHGRCMRELIVVLWRAGLRIREALMLADTDLDERRSSVMVRHSTSTRTSRRRGSARGRRPRALRTSGPPLRSNTIARVALPRTG